ncbi:MAG: ABC transporter ATP-binding protein [Bacillota bacterium]
MLRIENLNKSYDHRPVLRDIDLTVEPGTVFGLLGPNGMGKTTLLNCIAGVITPDGGRITYEGRDLLTDFDLKQRLGYVDEHLNYYAGFRVDDLVRFFRMTYSNWSDDRHKQLRKVFDLPAGERVKNLSKGMRTQLGLLLNLSMMPEILLLDEPTSGLDPVVRQKVLNIIVDQVASSGTAVLIANHNTHELERLCDAVAFIKDGEIVLNEELDVLRQQLIKVQVIFEDHIPAEIADHTHLLSVERLGRMYTLVGRSELLPLLRECDTVHLESVDTSLEEIYIQYMEGLNDEQDQSAAS